MKKGLSVLLIAAALFGFYGGATNLNDVLACKDYFESASGASDDMQRLEDGLNQLKDNEQAYLDGQVALADGQKALADAEVQLADGEKQLAEGRKTLAKGEADYAAAPAKLAAGREGLKKLKQAIDGINLLKSKDGYPKWRKNYEDMKDAREQFYAGTKSLYKSMLQLGAFLPESRQKAYAKAVKDVAKDDGKQTYDDYNTYIASTNNLAKNIPVIQKTVKESYESANQLYSLLKAQKTNFDFAKTVSTYKSGLDKLAALIETANGKKAAETYLSTVESVANAYKNFDATVDANYEKYLASEEGQQTEAYLISQNMDAGWDQFWTTANGKKAIAGTKLKMYIAGGGSVADPTNPTPEELAAADSAVSDDAAKTTFKNSGSDEAIAAEAGIKAGVKQKVDAGIKENVKAQVLAAYEDEKGDLTKARVGLTVQYAKAKDGGVIGSVVSSLKEINETLNGKKSAVKNTLLPGLKKFNKATKKKDGKNGAKQLLEGQNDSVANGVKDLVSGILGDDEMKANLIKKVGKAKVNAMKKYGTKNSPLYSKNSDFAQFEKKMDSNPGVMAFLKKALPVVKARRAAGLDTYNQGLKDYADAPAKLADGRKQLAEGEAQLADGYAQYEDGKKQLEDGKAQLAVYEDGEQQVRDGLATLVGTQPMGSVQGIADRIGNDTDFDNGDNHLELDEGLSAVDAGKGYAADLTEAVTSEIMGRAVGTGFLLGAGALAVLAALLSFLKKNKGAGVSAILSAVTGCIGAFMGNSAGTEFSSIAGSAVGATPWIAAGILAVVAAVHAIVHFAPKKEAK